MLIKTRVSRPEKKECAVCKNKCVDDMQAHVPRMDMDRKYSGRITRNMSKTLKIMNKIDIYEVYRCMPLLGDEKNNAPDWEVHIVHFAVVFSGC